MIFKDLLIAGISSSFLDPITADFDYYGSTMVWHEYVLYQAMAMAAIFILYVCIFLRVGDRRRMVLSTITIFSMVGVLRFFANGADNYGSELNWDLNEKFVSLRSFELWCAQWGVVSLFLVPQLLGNWWWEVLEDHGRPLSAWFYVGLPFVQSLPHVFTIAKHFQLVSIFARYDPYVDSIHGFHHNYLATPWWQMGVVLYSAWSGPCCTLPVCSL